MPVKEFKCHVCFRDENCKSCKCTHDKGKPLVWCECESCYYDEFEWCECECHQEVADSCKRCKNTGKIIVEVRG